MKQNNHVFHVHSLGRFSLSIGGEPVSSPWPNELTKELFCSLLSPLDECITFDRLSRSLFGKPLTESTRVRLDEVIEGLIRFTDAELGINPYRCSKDAIGLNRSDVYVDAHLFQELALEGLRKVSIGDSASAMRNIHVALSLYTGDFLPGMNRKIIADTREDLASLKRMLVPVEIPRTDHLPQYAPVRGVLTTATAVFA